MILLAVLVLALLVTLVAYPFARMIGDRRYRQGEPTWWSMKLHSGDREAALAEDRARHDAREARRARRRERFGRGVGRGDPEAP